MRILVVSDTHGYAERIEDVLAAEKEPVDMLIHAGDVEGQEDYIRSLIDGPVYMVRGNNDWGSDLKRERIITVGDHRIFLCHGNQYGISLDVAGALDEAISRHADILIVGHTHRPMIQKRDSVLILNPGSLAYPRQIGRKPTYIMMEINQNRDVRCDIRQL